MTATVYEPKGWQQAILRDLRAPVTPANVAFENAWFDEEHGPSGAMGGYNQGGAYNPFDTTLGSPQSGGGAPKGSTVYNSVGVMNYPSASAGISETVKTLDEPPYRALVAGLRSGSLSLAQLEQLENQSPWGTAFPHPSNTPPAVPGSGPGSISATLTSYPGGNLDPLNWGSAVGSAVWSGLGKVLLEIALVGLGGALVVVGGYKAAGKPMPTKLAGLAVA